MSVIEIEQSGHTRLTLWMGFHAGNVGDRNRAEEAHTTLTFWMGFHAGNVNDRN